MQVDLISWTLPSPWSTQLSKPDTSTPLYTSFAFAPQGNTRSNALPARSKPQHSSAQDTFSFGIGAGGKMTTSNSLRRFDFLPTFFFFPPSFKCQAPTWFLWEFEQLVRSVWKQNKPQHISPFAELSKRRHALQSGDDSAFSSLGLGCRPKIQNIFFVHLCWIRAYFWLRWLNF